MKAPGRQANGQGYFQICEGSAVIILNDGNYRKVDLYKRGKSLFAEATKGRYVRLSQNGSTSNPKMLWDEIIHDRPIAITPSGLMEE